MKDISNKNNIYIVAVEADKIIGLCFAEMKKTLNSKIMKDRTVMHISNICISREKQRKGIGERLYKEILKISKELEVDSIELMVWSFNRNAMNFYKKLGMNVKNVKLEQKSYIKD